MTKTTKMLFKGLFTAVPFFIFQITVLAQGVTFGTEIVEKPNTYLGVSTGINNHSGIFGLNMEFLLSDDFSLTLAAGLGSWGYKIGGGALYYTQKTQPFGSALGISYGYSTGSGSATLSFTDSNGKKVDVYLHPVSTINPTYSHAWKIGRKYNRFVLTTGYSIRVTSDSYSPVNNAIILTQEAKSALNLMSPGGLILGLGFIFGF